MSAEAFPSPSVERLKSTNQTVFSRTPSCDDDYIFFYSHILINYLLPPRLLCCQHNISGFGRFVEKKQNKKCILIHLYRFTDRTAVGSLMKVIVSRSAHLIEGGRNKLMLGDSDRWIKLNQRQSNTISVALLQGGAER